MALKALMAFASGAASLPLAGWAGMPSAMTLTLPDHPRHPDISPRHTRRSAQ